MRNLRLKGVTWTKLINTTLGWNKCLSSGCKVPWTARLEQQNLISYSSGGCKSRIRISTWSDSGESLFPRGLLPSRGRKRVGEKALWRPFYKSANLIHDGSILWPNYFPKARPPNTITLDVEISAYEFWGGHKSIVHNNRKVHYKWKSIAQKNTCDNIAFPGRISHKHENRFFLLFLKVPLCSTFSILALLILWWGNSLLVGKLWSCAL